MLGDLHYRFHRLILLLSFTWFALITLLWPYSRSWSKWSMPSIYQSQFHLEYLEYIIRKIFKCDMITNFKYWCKIRKWPRPYPYLGKILSREPNDFESSFGNRPICNPWKGIFPMMYTFRTIPETDLAFSSNLAKYFFSKNCRAPRPRKFKHIIWQFNYAHHLTGPFCDDVQQQKIIHGPLSGHVPVAGPLLGQKS